MAPSCLQVLAVDLPRFATWKTLQGSELSVKCGAGSDIVSIVPQWDGEYGTASPNPCPAQDRFLSTPTYTH